MIPIALGARNVVASLEYLGFFGQVLTALPVAALGAWFVVLTSRERHTLGASLASPGFASTVK